MKRQRLEMEEHDGDELEDLLKSWGVEPLHSLFISYGITIEHLMSMEDMDYSNLTMLNPKMFGNIITFRGFHREWKQKNKENSKIVNVETILECEKGHEIKEFFKENGHLTHEIRLKLGYLILEGRKITRGMMIGIAEQIVAIFPNELKDYFYQKVRGRPPTGILIVCLNALNAKASKSSLKANQSVETNSPKSVSLTVESEEVSISDEIRSSIDILNDEANMHNTDLIVKHWTATHAYRSNKKYQTAVDAVNDWRPLREPIGSYLIHYDFVQKYGDASGEALLKGFNDFIDKNHEVLLNQIKNALVRQQLRQALSEPDSNTQTLNIVMALFHMNCMVPVSVSSEKCLWTPTIPDAKGAFCCTAVDENHIAHEFKKRSDLNTLKGIDTAPLIFYVSDSETFFVRYQELYFKGENFLDAVDTAFKIIAIFKVPLPLDSSKIWHFLNAVFFKIQLSDAPTSEFISKISTLNY